MAEIPQAATVAATDAFIAEHTGRGWVAPAPWWCERVVAVILTAAAPHIAAAECDRLQPELNRIEHDAIARYEEFAARQAAVTDREKDTTRERHL
jgi:hypothetical protein